MQKFITLLDAEERKKPILVFGPTHSGKKTRMGEALRGRKFHVVEHSRVPDEVRGNSLLGRLAHIVDADTLRLPKLVAPGALLIYVCQDPFRWASQSELRSKFEVVDLSRELRTLDYEVKVDERDANTKQAPWEALKQICYARTFDEKEKLCSVNPNLVELLRNNALEFGTMDSVARLYSHLSDTDLMSYSMNKDTKLTLDTVAAIQMIGIEPHYRLKYGGWKPPPYVRKFEKERDLWIPAVLKENPKKRKPAAGKGNAPKKQRAPPKCRACGVPLKGHKCPKKK